MSVEGANLVADGSTQEKRCKTTIVEAAEVTAKHDQTEMEAERDLVIMRSFVRQTAHTMTECRRTGIHAVMPWYGLVGMSR